MKRIVRWSAYVAIGLVLAVLAVALILPEFLDSSGVEADLQRSLSQAVGGEVRWEKLQLRLLPTPRGVLRRLQVELPGISARSEQVDASLALLPLLRGRAEIVSVKLARPAIRIELAPAATDANRSAPSREDAGEAYRRIMGEVVRALREFAPDAVVEIRNGEVDIRAPGAQPFMLRELSAQARSTPVGLELHVDTASDYWQRLRLSANVADADLAASASLEIADLKRPGSPLPPASLRAKAHTDGKTSAELTLEEARRGGTRVGPGVARYAFKDALLSADVAFDVDLAQAVAAARASAVPLGGVESARGHISGKVTVAARGETWKAEVQVLKSDVLVDGWGLPAPVGLAGGAVAVDSSRLRFDRVALSLAGSRATVSATLAGYRTSSLAIEASAAVELDFAEAFKAAGPLTARAGIEAATGRVSAQATASSRGDAWKVAVRIAASDASIRGWRLPAAAGLSGGSATIDARRIAFENIGLSAGDGRAVLSGTLTDYASHPVVDGRIESPGIVVDALIPKPDEAKKPAPDKSLWPLPVSGRVALHSDFIRYERYDFAPVSALLTLESDSARLEIKEAALCGLSLPLSFEAREEGLSVSSRITAQRQQIAETARCLTHERVQITGEYDLRAELNTRGKAAELVRNLDGTLAAEARDGQLMQFALIGNILAAGNVTALFKGTKREAGAPGLAYRAIAVKGRFGGGRLNVDETSFRSPVAGLVGNGWISLVEPESRLTVLVAPFARLDKAARMVPIVGYISGGALTSIPVGVSGDIRDPLVVPLGPGAITSEVKGIFERTLKLPARLVPALPGAPADEPASKP